MTEPGSPSIKLTTFSWRWEIGFPGNAKKSVLYDIKLIKKEDNSFKKASIQGEKVVLAKCQKALIGGTKLLPTSALGRPRSPLLASILSWYSFTFQLKQTCGSLLRYPGEQGDEVYRGNYLDNSR